MSDPSLIIQRQIQALQDDGERLRKADSGASSGTSMPSSPPTNMRFFRTDLGLACYYDGTRWLTEEQFQCDLTPYARNAQPFAGAGPSAVLLAPQRTDYATYYVRAKAYMDVLTTNDATNYWILTLVLGATTVWTVNTSADAPGTGINKSDTTAAVAASAGIAVANLQKNNAPGNVVLNVSYWYRLIIT